MNFVARREPAWSWLSKRYVDIRPIWCLCVSLMCVFCILKWFQRLTIWWEWYSYFLFFHSWIYFRSFNQCLIQLLWLIGLCKLSRTNVAFEINIHCNRSNSVKFIHKPWSMNNKYSDHKSDYGIIARLQHACCASYQELTTSAPNLNSKIVVVVNLWNSLDYLKWTKREKVVLNSLIRNGHNEIS